MSISVINPFSSWDVNAPLTPRSAAPQGNRTEEKTQWQIMKIEFQKFGQEVKSLCGRTVHWFRNDFPQMVANGCKTYQRKMDAVGAYIQATFKPLEKFNEWIDSNGKGEWYKQLATFLVKLPVRAIRNIVSMIYNIIKYLCYAAVHPLKALEQLVDKFNDLIEALTKPEVWSKIGAGVIGASLGNAAVSGNPVSVIGFGIGIAMLIGGLSVGTISEILTAKKGEGRQAAKAYLWERAKELPESMLTGFMMGLMFGGIQRAAQQHAHKTMQPTNDATARQWANRYTSYHNLPKPTNTYYAGNGQVVMRWTPEQMARVVQIKPSLPYSAQGLIFSPGAPHHVGLFENTGLTNTLPFVGSIPAAQKV